MGMRSLIKSGTITVFLVFTMLPSAVSGQTYPDIKWWVDLDAPSFGSAAVADLDGDGVLEIVFGTYFNDEKIHCLNGEDGSHLWVYPTGSCNDASPVIADVDNDQDLEVIVPGSATQTVYCLDGTTGTLEWSTNEGHCIDSPPAIADVDDDGDLEIVNGTFNGYVFCLDADSGYIAWQCSLGTQNHIEACPNIHDFDGDGALEVVVAEWMGDCRVYCLDGATGTVEWFSDAPSDWMYHGGSFADVDEDGLPEIAIGCYDSNVYLLNGEDGSTEWTFAAPAYACGPTSIADLNCDGHLEVVYATGSGMGVISHTGSGIWSAGSSGSIFRGAAISNIDGDTIPDVIYGTSGGYLVARRGSAGELLWEIDLEDHYGDTFDIDHAPTIADFDGDGKLDVFIVGGQGTSSSPANNHGRAYMIAAGEGTGPGWPMFRYDVFRSGYFDGTGTGIESSDPVVPAVTLTCFPNPCHGSISIDFRLSEPAQTGIHVFDLSGRLVDEIPAAELTEGEHSVRFDTAALETGVYFVRLTAGFTEECLRILVLH
jgi:outer membrane protein assembly factor BamB